MTPDRPKPLLAAAFTCEKILREADGVISAIRIIDTFVLPHLPKDAVPTIRWWALVYLKSGDAIGRYEVALALRNPSGASRPLGDPVQIELLGGAHGVNLALELRLAIKDVGLYWLDVFVDRERVTSMPITLRVQDVDE